MNSSGLTKKLRITNQTDEEMLHDREKTGDKARIKLRRISLKKLHMKSVQAMTDLL
jgi:hypothetical protein